MLRYLFVSLIIWLCLFIPFYSGVNYIEHTSSRSVEDCLHTFISTENNNISNTISIGMKKDISIFKQFAQSFRSSDISKVKRIANISKKFLDTHADIVSMKICDQSGSLIYTSNKYDNNDILKDDEFKQADTGHIAFTLFPENEKNPSNILISYLVMHKIGNNKYFFKFTVPWKKYSTFGKSVDQGVFPRFFYVISPTFSRYISLEGHFVKQSQKSLAVILGCHLANKDVIKDKHIGETVLFMQDNIPFRVNIAKINPGKNVKGPTLTSVIATDSTAITILAKNLLKGIDGAFFVGLILTLLIAFALAKRYTSLQAKLKREIAFNRCAPCPVLFIKCDNYVITFYNTQALNLFRATDNLIGTEFFKFVIDEREISYIKSAISSLIPIRNYDILLQLADGSSLWASISIDVVEIDGVSHAAIGAYDVSYKKQMEEKTSKTIDAVKKNAQKTIDTYKEQADNALRESVIAKETMNKAIALEAEKTEFLKHTSLALNLPANVISEYSEILLEEAKYRHDEREIDLRRINNSAQYLSQAVEEIYNVAVEDGNNIKKLNLDNCRISDIVFTIDTISRILSLKNNNKIEIQEYADLGYMYTSSVKLIMLLSDIFSYITDNNQNSNIVFSVKDDEDSQDFIKFEFSIIRRLAKDKIYSQEDLQLNIDRINKIANELNGTYSELTSDLETILILILPRVYEESSYNSHEKENVTSEENIEIHDELDDKHKIVIESETSRIEEDESFGEIKNGDGELVCNETDGVQNVETVGSKIDNVAVEDDKKEKIETTQSVDNKSYEDNALFDKFTFGSQTDKRDENGKN